MGQMLVRNLDDAVVERLKRKALAREAGGDDRAAWVAGLDALRATVPEPPPPGSVVADIRAWRDHDRLAGPATGATSAVEPCHQRWAGRVPTPDARAISRRQQRKG